MPLSRPEIIKSIQVSKIKFDPCLDKFQIQPHSIDLRLGWNFYIPKNWGITEKGRVGISIDYLDAQSKKDNFDLIKLKPGQYFEILPKEFIIASTMEKITIDDDKLMALLYPRSSLTRRGLFIASGIVDAKYNGYLALSLLNNTETQIIKLYPGERICQLIFEPLSSPLSLKESIKHGVGESKYFGAAPYSLEAKSDNHDEIELIRAGKIQDLKDRFKL